MLEIVATSPESNQKSRRAVPANELLRVGRSPQSGWAIPWDAQISSEHADLSMQGEDRVMVRRLSKALNPIWFHDKPVSEFTVAEGEEFRIGLTLFKVVSVNVGDAEIFPVEEKQYSSNAVRNFRFHDADLRLEVLWNLPRLIAASLTEEEFAEQVVKILLQGISRGGAAAVVEFPIDPAQRNMSTPMLMRWESRKEESGRFRPSRRLMQKALDAQETTLQIWNDSEKQDLRFTMSGEFDWAICTPIQAEASRGWCLYVSGASSGGVCQSSDLHGDVRFMELVAHIIGALRHVGSLERQRSSLSQFFSPSVKDAMKRTLSNNDSTEELLKPRESNITVLFCDLRGFSRKSEKGQEDLHKLFERCSEAMGVMTRGILKFDGAIADFQGDAAVGFWGWPVETSDGPLPACRAALEIQREFLAARREPNNPLSEFQCGIGIAHGRAIAGKIGTKEQAKVGVFGPVVNLAARLESMTKQMRVPILLDESTAKFVRRGMPATTARVRTLGHVRPAGLDSSLTVSQLIPPFSEQSDLTDENIQMYERAVSALIDGDWDEALDVLGELPVTDRAKDFLMVFIALNQYEPPTNWEGTIEMPRK